MYRERINLTIDANILKKFKRYAREKGLNMSRVIEKYMLEELQSISSFCITPAADGAFYFLLEIATDLNSMDLAQRLIREHRVAVIPGITFGMQDACYLRVAYGALDQQTGIEGIQRLTHGLSAIVN